MSHFSTSPLNITGIVLKNSILYVVSICHIVHDSNRAAPVQPRMGREALGVKEQGFVGEVRI